MTEQPLLKTLKDIPLGSLRTFERIGSTNDEALTWATEGAPDLSLVFAEEQTAGRGRGDRRWFSSKGSGLAFSLIIKPSPSERSSILLFSGLGALAVREGLIKLGLKPEIKWPNDILLNRQKVCGILVESIWAGDEIESVILGIGINIKPQSIPPSELLNFPATCLGNVMEKSIDRFGLLHDILTALLDWRKRMTNEIFLQSWSNSLAFRGEQVEIQMEHGATRTGQIEDLESDGSLILRLVNGQKQTIHFGEVHLRPVV
jgi:BirA family transcriptional regulator, biotin operon repressor / biotin---[acetyl-CoA-carboxylase] ligase